MTSPELPRFGDAVICADDEPLGVVDADEGTHLRVRRPHELPPTVWIPKRIIAGHDDGTVRLLLNRDELHDGVIALPPARQREYASLESISLLLQRRREPSRSGATPS